MHFRIEYRRDPAVIAIHVDLQIVRQLEVFNEDDEPTGALAPFARELQAIPGVIQVGVAPDHIWLRRKLAFSSYDVVVGGLTALQRHIAERPMWETGKPVVHPDLDPDEQPDPPHTGPTH